MFICRKTGESHCRRSDLQPKTIEIHVQIHPALSAVHTPSTTLITASPSRELIVVWLNVQHLTSALASRNTHALKLRSVKWSVNSQLLRNPNRPFHRWTWHHRHRLDGAVVRFPLIPARLIASSPLVLPVCIIVIVTVIGAEPLFRPASSPLFSCPYRPLKSMFRSDPSLSRSIADAERIPLSGTCPRVSSGSRFNRPRFGRASCSSSSSGCFSLFRFAFDPLVFFVCKCGISL